MRVKICGITNLEDALNAIEFGADALGFVFYEKSPRYIEPKVAREIITKLPPFVQSIGLFVNVSSDLVNLISNQCKINLAQIHFEANENFFKKLKIPHLKVVRASSKEDILKFESEYRIVDAFVESYGGEGKRVNLDWFSKVDCSKIILAGGLSCENVVEVLDFGFYGVDVSSGVESYKGKKDKKKLENFLKKVKRVNS